jgi:hypothetical protein
LLEYLAIAQFLGLEGLWRRLCAGKLPARCTKRWCFETFCGTSAAQFDARDLEALGGEVDIRRHLNGFVKPYDVVAMMGVLPGCAAWFPPAERVGPHVLRLRAQETVDTRAVVQLLRDTYHEVALCESARGCIPDRPFDLRLQRASLELRVAVPLLRHDMSATPPAEVDLHGAFGAAFAPSPQGASCEQPTLARPRAIFAATRSNTASSLAEAAGLRRRRCTEPASLASARGAADGPCRSTEGSFRSVDGSASDDGVPSAHFADFAAEPVRVRPRLRARLRARRPRAADRPAPSRCAAGRPRQRRRHRQTRVR